MKKVRTIGFLKVSITNRGIYTLSLLALVAILAILIILPTGKFVQGYDINGNIINQVSSWFSPFPSVLSSGDVNGDGKVDISDVVLANGYLVGTTKLTPDQIKRADVDADGRVTKRDVNLIMDYSIGLIHKLPAMIGDVNED